MNLDDEFLRPFGSTTHQLVIIRLLSSITHLQLVAHSLQAFGNGLVFPQYSLLRSALTGASTAHWAIAGDESSRRENVLRLAKYDLREHVKFSKTVRGMPVQGGRRMPEIVEATRVLADENDLTDAMYSEYRSILTLRGEPTILDRRNFGKINETDIVNEMAKILQHLGHIPHEVELKVEYQIMCGFVHNCVWATYKGAYVQSAHADDLPFTRITGNSMNIHRAAQRVLTVVRLAKNRAIRLAEQSR